MKKALFLCLIVCLTVFFSLGSADEHGIQNVILDENGARIVFRAPVDAIYAQNLTATINNGEEIPVDFVRPVSPTEGINTTWFFIVDVPSDRVNTVRKVVQSLVGLIKNGDNGQILEVSQAIPIVDALTGEKALLNEKAKNLKARDRKTIPALASAVNAALERIIHGMPGIRERVCIVLISGFTDDYDSDYSFMLEHLNSTRTALYLVKLKMEGKPNVNLLSQYKGLIERIRFGAMMELSKNNDAGAVEARAAIQNQEEKFKVVGVKKTDIQKGDILTLTLSQDSRIIKEEYIIPGKVESDSDKVKTDPGAMKETSAETTESKTEEPTEEQTEEQTTEPTIEPTVEPTVAPTTEPTAEPTSEPTAEPTAEPIVETTATLSTWEKIVAFVQSNYITIICAAVIIVLVIALVRLLRANNNKKPEPDNHENSKSSVIRSEISPPHLEVVDGEHVSRNSSSNEYVPTELDTTRNHDTHTDLEVTIVSSDGLFHAKKHINSTMAIGRNPAANLGNSNERVDIRLPENYVKISNCHALLTYEHGIMYIEDVSKNGTWVNGKKVDGRIAIKSNSSITMGHIDFMIKWS